MKSEIIEEYIYKMGVKEITDDKGKTTYEVFTVSEYLREEPKYNVELETENYGEAYSEYERLIQQLTYIDFY